MSPDLLAHPAQDCGAGPESLGLCALDRMMLCPQQVSVWMWGDCPRSHLLSLSCQPPWNCSFVLGRRNVLIWELDQHPKGIYFSAEGKWLQF